MGHFNEMVAGAQHPSSLRDLVFEKQLALPFVPNYLNRFGLILMGALG